MLVGILLQPIRDYLDNLYRTLTRGWNRFWFTPADPTTLTVIRIVTGLVMLYAYLGSTADILNLVGRDAWIDDQAIQQIQDRQLPGVPVDAPLTRWWGLSIWAFVRDPRWILLLHGVLLAAIVSFTLGLFSRLSNAVVWIGHLSFLHRSFVTGYGLDSILAMLLFYMLLAPTGATLSLDQMIRQRRSRRVGAAFDEPGRFWTTNAVIRLIQIHLCIIYLCSGLAKLQGQSWWNGTAIWQILVIPELSPFDLRWIAQLPDWGVALVSETGVAVTLAFEIGFAFLIWNRLLRPLILAAAFVLHGLIGLVMGLGAFSAIMLTACLAFVPPESMRWFLNALRRRPAAPDADEPLLRPEEQAREGIVLSG
jgi:hypothetical protein